VKLHGCTVHFVTPQSITARSSSGAVPVRTGDSEAALAARVLRQEHRIYPLRYRWLVEGRLVPRKRSVRVTDLKPASRSSQKNDLVPRTTGPRQPAYRKGVDAMFLRSTRAASAASLVSGAFRHRGLNDDGP